MLDVSRYTGFVWDKGNSTKSREKHGVTIQESEEVFSNHPRVILRDTKHSQVEQRYVIMGVTNAGRQVTVIFTTRGDRIRVISARDQTEGRERELFKRKAK